MPGSCPLLSGTLCSWQLPLYVLCSSKVLTVPLGDTCAPQVKAEEVSTQQNHMRTVWAGCGRNRGEGAGVRLSKGTGATELHQCCC